MTANTFSRSRLKDASQCLPGFVQLRLSTANCAIQFSCDLLVFEALDIVKLKNGAIAGGEAGNGAFDGQTINCTGLSQVRSAKLTSCTLFGDLCGQLIE